MGKRLAELMAGDRPVVWLDFYDYAGALFAGASGIPWFDDAAFAAFHAKAQGLLRSDVVGLPVVRIADALLAARPTLAAAMRAKSRPGYPLRRLLEEDDLRQAVAALLVPLRAATADRPLALMLPSPRQWLAAAYAAAHGDSMPAEHAADADEIDGAAVYVADFVRDFAESGADVLLLCESTTDGPASADELALYDPVFGTARHYRWEVGLLDAAGRLPPGAAGTLDFLITPAEAAAGRLLPESFWQAEASAGGAAVRLAFAAVPAGAKPETVLERIAALRGQG